MSDNGPCYVSSELKDWLKDNNVPHTRGKPYHPQTQGKIERWHRTLKNRILLENHYLPGDLERQLRDFVNHYNTRRYHESLNNLTPECVFTGRNIAVLKKRNQIKRERTLEGLKAKQGQGTPPCAAPERVAAVAIYADFHENLRECREARPFYKSGLSGSLFIQLFPSIPALEMKRRTQFSGVRCIVRLVLEVVIRRKIPV